jgi:serine/threonine protein kinase
MFYQVKELGRGGFGVVDLVRDECGQEFARKTLNAVGVDDKSTEELKRRFIREIHYQSSIKHPNVVKIVSYDQSASPPYYLMEVAENNLYNEMSNSNIPEGGKDKVLFDILSGLEHIHQSGFAHRDLKPGNILKYRNSDSSCRYAISDFGLVSNDSSESTTLTLTNMQGGSTYHAAPELASDFKRASTLSDIYSFGAIIHDMYGSGNRVPYTEIQMAGPLGPVVLKCTRLLPQRRYTSIELLRSELYEALQAIKETSFNYQSAEVRDILELLSNQNISTSDWDKIFIYVEKQHRQNLDMSILQKINAEHIRSLHEDDLGIFISFCHYYCDYVMNNKFIFEFCDVLADRLSLIYDLSNNNIEIRSIVILTLLLLGTSHNRWLVEKKFMGLCSATMDSGLANRVRIETNARRIDFPSLIRHVERSIGISRDDLHPTLRGLVNDM